MNEGDSPPPTDRDGDTGKDDQQYRTDDTETGEETREVPRKNALSTLAQSLRWLVGLPVLLAAFLLTDLVGAVTQFLDPVLGLVVLPIGWILSLGTGGLAYVYTDRHIRNEEGTFSDAVSTVLAQIGSLIALAVFSALIIAIGFVLLVLPGIYLAVRLGLAFPACVLDRQGVSESLSTSWDVADGNLLKIFGISLALAPFAVLPVVVGITGGVELIDSAMFELATAPVSALLSGIYAMAIARVYLENR
jgi:hypothetical protein